MRLAILTDTNSGIQPPEAEALGVHLLPMPFHIGQATYLEGISLSPTDFYQYLHQGAEVSTSQPSPADTNTMWDTLLTTHDAVLYIPMSSGLSGTCATALSLAQEDEYRGRVFVVDNKRISAPLRQAVLDAITLARRGLSPADIRDQLEAEALHAQIFIMVDTLQYLKKGGRVTPAAALLGSALNLKPILQLRDGKLDAYKKVRGLKSAQQELIRAVQATLTTLPGQGQLRIQTAYSGAAELGLAWNQLVQQAFPGQEIYNTPLPLSVVCHTGPGALGIACVRETAGAASPA